MSDNIDDLQDEHDRQPPPPSGIDLAEKHIFLMVKVATIIAIVAITAFGYFRMFLPYLAEQGDLGKTFAVIMTVAGIAGLVLAAVWLRRLLLPNKSL